MSMFRNLPGVPRKKTEHLGIGAWPPARRSAPLHRHNAMPKGEDLF